MTIIVNDDGGRSDPMIESRDHKGTGAGKVYNTAHPTYPSAALYNNYPMNSYFTNAQYYTSAATSVNNQTTAQYNLGFNVPSSQFVQMASIYLQLTAGPTGASIYIDEFQVSDGAGNSTILRDWGFYNQGNRAFLYLTDQLSFYGYGLSPNVQFALNANAAMTDGYLSFIFAPVAADTLVDSNGSVLWPKRLTGYSLIGYGD